MQTICRICESKDNLVNLIKNENVHVRNMLKDIANISFSCDDQLPKSVCQKCKEKISVSFEFKSQIEATDLRLRKLLLLQSSNCSVGATEYTELKTEFEQVADNYLVLEIEVEQSEDVSSCHTKIEESKDTLGNELLEPIIPLQEDFSANLRHITQTLIPKKRALPTAKCTTAEKTFECYICQKSYNLRKSLRAHFKRNHIDVLNQIFNRCKTCAKTFFNKTSLQRHVRDVHQRVKPYKCGKCDKLFSQKITCKIHEMTHNDDRPFNCSACGKDFKSPQNLKVHFRYIHEGRRYPRLRAKKRDPAYRTCEYCGKYVRAHLYSTHLRIHSDENPNIICKPREFHTCELCGKQINKRNFLVHLKTHTGEAPFKCEICDKSFKQLCGKNYHMRTHTGEKPYKCNICDKSFTQKSSMACHLKIHSDDFSHKCTMCDMTFRQAAHLRSHMLIHTGEKNHICSFCSKSFAHKHTLTCHIRQHTGETPYHCTVCSKKFNDLNGLKRHRKVHD